MMMDVKQEERYPAVLGCLFETRVPSLPPPLECPPSMLVMSVGLPANMGPRSLIFGMPCDSGYRKGWILSPCPDPTGRGVHKLFKKQCVPSFPTAADPEDCSRRTVSLPQMPLSSSLRIRTLDPSTYSRATFVTNERRALRSKELLPNMVRPTDAVDTFVPSLRSP
jgi:hypothetical protein